MSADHNPLVIKTTITIADIEPPIWRRLLLPRELNFAQLHEVIQAAYRERLKGMGDADGRRTLGAEYLAPACTTARRLACGTLASR